MIMAVVPMAWVSAFALAAVGVGLGIRALWLAKRGVISDRALGIIGITLSVVGAAMCAIRLSFELGVWS